MADQIQNDEQNREFAAEMTKRQFAALRIKLNKNNLISELGGLASLQKCSLSSACNNGELIRWLMNGWNTEHLLLLTKKIFDKEDIQIALQWAFPQAYYSVFAIFQAFLQSQGQSIKSHSSGLKTFGYRVINGKYPKTLTFYADGVNPTKFVGVAKNSSLPPMAFDSSDMETIDHQVTQFLNGTRKIQLNEQREKMKKIFRTKSGAVKKRLAPEEWNKINKAIGPTTIVNCLYRKRIKSNYLDIGTFMTDNISAHNIYQDLVHIVSCLNFVHEAYIFKAIGIDEMQKIIKSRQVKANDSAKQRIKFMINL